MDSGITREQGFTDYALYNINGYGKFGTLYMLTVDQMAVLRDDLQKTINLHNASLTDSDLARIAKASAEGTVKITVPEEEVEE